MDIDLVDNFFDTVQIINKIHQRDPYSCISQGLVSDFGIFCSFKSSVLLALRNIFHGYWC